MEESISLANQAVAYDTAHRTDAAVYCYTQAAQFLLDGIAQGTIAASFRDKAEQYIQRAETLRNTESLINLQPLQRTCQQADLEKAEFLLGQALDEDAKGNMREAVDLYSDAVAVCIEGIKLLVGAENRSLKQKLENLAAKALDRAEELKAEKAIDLSRPPTEGLSEFDRLSVSATGSEGASPSASPRINRGKNFADTQEAGGPPPIGAKYTAHELEVLRITSMVNGREYVPFLSIDLQERFAFPVPYSDKHGLLKLSSKQNRHFLKWVRPTDFLGEPCIISRVNSTSIKQTVVSDCSFIASLAIAARYEERFKKRLISSIIYPQSKAGDPVVNPCGKYMIKFHFNGINRKVIIDDFLPIGKHGELLCSFSNNRNELWVSLLEKAYMKIMGGYDFPGSNSNIDLHVLTGWIPERIAIAKNEKDFDPEAVFGKLFERFHAGDCLITVATGKMSDAESERTGLVDCHAYAMLDIRQILGKKLLLLKNPWNHLRWKGRFSERDTENWTTAMSTALHYDRKSAQQFDDGEFWIDFESICAFFDVFYVNWRPNLFPFKSSMHGSWSAGVGPTKDLYNIGENPQYRLELEKPSSGAAVWILLTRHITDKDDFANNREYITILVYESGKKVYYPFDPPPIVDGNRINSPHYLCKLKLNAESSSKFTLVVSQYEKTATIYYTLRVYATCQISLTRLECNFRHRKKETGEWKGKSAGGCANYPETWKFNPVFELSLDRDVNELLIDLRGPKQYSVGLDFVPVNCSSNFSKRTSGNFRSGFCVLPVEKIPSGTYHIIPATFLQGQEGPFILNVLCSSAFSLTRK